MALQGTNTELLPMDALGTEGWSSMQKRCRNHVGERNRVGAQLPGAATSIEGFKHGRTV
jgi:hypothetical protein